MTVDLADEAGFGSLGHAPIRTPASDTAARLRNEILHTNPVAQIAVGTDGHLAMVNSRAEAMLGLSDRDLGRPHLTSPTAPLTCGRSWQPSPRAARRFGYVRWSGAVTHSAYVDVNLVPLLDTAGEVLGVSISFTDVTRFRQLRVEVETANRQLELAYERTQSTRMKSSRQLMRSCRARWRN